METMINVGIGQDDRVSLPEQKPPPIERMGLVRGAKPTTDEVQIIVRQEALAAIDAHGGSNLRSELGGVLLGRAFQHNGLTYVQIDAAVIAQSDQHGPIHFTFTADAWANIHVEREEKYPDLQIVGWYHTHPDLGVFYSSDDVVVHSVAFDMPWHVGLVFDPVRRECCFFGWFATAGGQQELDPIRGFYELTNVQGSSMVDWRVTHRSGLAEMVNAAYENYSSAGEVYNDQVYTVTREATLFPPRINFAIASSAVLLTLALFTFTFFNLRARNNALEDMALLLASDRLQGQVDAGLAICPNPQMQIIMLELPATVTQGDELDLFGVADFDQAGYYALQYKQVGPLNYRRYQPLNTLEWQQINSFKWARTFESLGRWNTTDVEPGTYHIRLVGYESRSNLLLNRSSCTIPVTVLPAPVIRAPDPTVAVTAAPAADETPVPDLQPAPTPEAGAATGGTTTIDN